MSTSLNLIAGLGLLAALGALSAWLTGRLTRPSSWWHVLDHPNERSLHTRPVPRTGGVAILVSVLAGGAIAYLWLERSTPLPWIGVGLLGVGLVSSVEDRWGVPRRYRLLIQLGAAGLLLAGGLGIQHLEFAGATLTLAPLLAWPLTLLYSVWMTNLYNFMDGLDGLAAGMAVFGFATLAWLGWSAGDPGFALASALVAAASGGFLIWNFPPAPIFMGDTGSTCLGFLAAALSLWGVQEGLFPLWITLLVFSPFILDASLTLLRRLVRGERIWSAHRSHYYQRLVGSGWSHRQTLLWAYLLMATCTLSATQAVGMAPHEQVGLVILWGALYGLIILKVRWLEQCGGAPAP